MSLFGPIYVTSTLTLSAKDAKALQDVARAVLGIDASLRALLDKLTEPPAEVLTPEQAATLSALNATQAAKVAALRDALTPAL